VDRLTTTTRESMLKTIQEFAQANSIESKATNGVSTAVEI